MSNLLPFSRDPAGARMQAQKRDDEKKRPSFPHDFLDQSIPFTGAAWLQQVGSLLQDLLAEEQVGALFKIANRHGTWTAGLVSKSR